MKEINKVKFWEITADGKTSLLFAIMFTVLVLFFFCQVSMAATQEVYPEKDITFICNSQPGGGNDLIARGFSQYFGQHVKGIVPAAKGGKMKVQNVTGGAGARAYIDIGEADPDGYTIGDFNSGQLYEYLVGTLKLPFDPRKYTYLFAPCSTTRLMVAPKKGFATWEEMLAGSKKEPLRWAVGQYGSAMHLESVYVKETVGIQAKFIIMEGSAKVISALLRGDVDVVFMSFEAARSAIESKDLNVLVTMTDQRVFPQVPTIGEKGFPQIDDYVGPYRTFVGPPNMDPEVKRVIIATAQKVMADPGFRDYLSKMGIININPIYDKVVYDKAFGYAKFYQNYESVIRKYIK